MKSTSTTINLDTMLEIVTYQTNANKQAGPSKMVKLRVRIEAETEEDRAIRGKIERDRVTEHIKQQKIIMMTLTLSRLL